MNILELTKFDMNSIQFGSTIVMVGRRQSGKSTLVQDLLQNHPEVSVNFINDECNNSDKPISVQDLLLGHPGFTYKPNNLKTIVVLDDYSSIKKTLLKPQPNTMLIVTLQFPMPVVAEADYIFLLCEPYLYNRKLLYDQYGGIFPTFDKFCQVMDQYTETDFGCLVIDRKTKSDNLEDNVFWYRAEVR